MSDLSVVQIGTIKTLVDTLADLDIAPLILHITAKKTTDTRPDINLWTQTRTDFEHLVNHYGIKAKESRWTGGTDQRAWHAEHDHEGHRLLIQCVSFAHHDDWQPKPDRKAPTQ